MFFLLLCKVYPFDALTLISSSGGLTGRTSSKPLCAVWEMRGDMKAALSMKITEADINKSNTPASKVCPIKCTLMLTEAAGVSWWESALCVMIQM